MNSLVAGLLIAATLAGCTTQAARQDQLPPPTPTKVTHGASACDPAAVRVLVKRFVGAYNAGDLSGLDALFAEEPAFRWFSANRPEPFTGGRRDELSSYFAKRRAAGEQLRLERFGFNGNSAGFGHFQFRLAGRAPKYRGGRWFRQVGKGAARCTDVGEKIAVWSM